ncbi:MAG: hypothetical protein Kow0069_27820 [Promethearchaeota archaeon]
MVNLVSPNVEFTERELKLVRDVLQDYLNEDFLAADLVPVAEGVVKKVSALLPLDVESR